MEITAKPIKHIYIILICILAIVFFLAIFQLSFINTPSDYYLNRDDAVITLSHARNLVDFGFIGVNPSGERIEGFSAPIQFLFYVITYGFLHLDYSTFFQLQIYLFTALLGLTFFIFYYLFTKSHITALILSTLSALSLSQLNTFILWHYSGMENAITNFFYLFAFLILFKFYQNKKISYWGIIPILLASFSRSESIFHISFLLLPFSFLYWHHTKDKRIFKFLAIFYSLWISIFALKSLYFGDIKPNTAYAQNINYSFNNLLKKILDTYNPLANNLNLILSKIIAAVLLITAFFAVQIIYIKRNRESVFLYITTISMIIAVFFHLFIFGYARLDPGRVVSFAAPFMILSLSCALWETHIKNIYKLTLGILLIVITFYMFGERYWLCCSAKDFEGTREIFKKITHEEHLMRPYIANPDLGIMSFYKEFNIIDLGMLGNEFLGKVRDEKNVSDYFFNFAQPDIVELHDYWSCTVYPYILENPKFDDLYMPYLTQRDKWLQDHCQSRPKITSGIWIRKDILATTNSPERHFMDDLISNLNVQRVSEELKNCQKSNDQHNCIYILKTIYRLLPEIKNKGIYGETIKAFENSQYSQYFKKVSIALLNSEKNNNISNDILFYLQN